MVTTFPCGHKVIKYGEELNISNRSRMRLDRGMVRHNNQRPHLCEVWGNNFTDAEKEEYMLMTRALHPVQGCLTVNGTIVYGKKK